MQLKRSSGVLAHITSFPSKFGIGDLGKGTYDFIDFLNKSNQKLWQTLPLGVTSYGDSPYQSFSTFAGNHILISLETLVTEGYLSNEDIENVPNFDKSKVEYGEVIQYKLGVLRKAHENFLNGATKEQKDAFKKFCKEEKYWLDDFALFISLKFHFIAERDQQFEPVELQQYRETNKNVLTEDQIKTFFYGAVWNSWPEDLVMRKSKAIKEWSKKLSDDIEFYKFTQYEFYRQWMQVKAYANERDIQVIGDIPIFIAMDSADVWANKQLFQLDKVGNPTSVAGVPPDYFSATGQLWGNPLYDWEANKKEKFAWWIKRVKAMVTLSDIIRIDHFRAFDEYWSIPYGEETAINGQWIKAPGYELFKAIEKSLGQLPIIAEDLGKMTDTVEQLRDDLKLPGMKILQFAFDDSEENDYLPHNFTNPNCVVYTGTHDNDTSVGWYKKATEVEQDHLRRYMNVSGEDVAWDLIRLAYASTAGFAIVPVQDLMKLDSDARMNTPGVAAGNWMFRYTEDMLTDEIANGLAYITKLFDR